MSTLSWSSISAWKHDRRDNWGHPMAIQMWVVIIDLQSLNGILPSKGVLGTKFCSYVGRSLDSSVTHNYIISAIVKCIPWTLSENILYTRKTSPRISSLKSLFVGMKQTDLSFGNPSRKRLETTISFNKRKKKKNSSTSGFKRVSCIRTNFLSWNKQ